MHPLSLKDFLDKCDDGNSNRWSENCKVYTPVNYSW